MKVLMINVVCGIRSTGRICTDLAAALETHGHEVKIAYGRERVPEQFQKYAVRIGADIDVKLHGLKARFFDGCGWGSKGATERFIHWVKDYDPDVIHLHNLHGYYINIEVLFKYLRTCKKKILWTLHDCWALTGHAAYCEAVNCERWITGCHNCMKMLDYPVSYTDRSASNWKRKRQLFSGLENLGIVTPSEWLARLVRKSYLSDYPVTVIHNGVDTGVFKAVDSKELRGKLGIGNKRVILGVAAIWDERKGLIDFEKLNNVIDRAKYQIIIVGLSKEQINELPAGIIGIERTNSIDELVQFYSLADVFLNLTYEDNYPTTNIEAIACGTPVITYNTGGSPESAKCYGSIIQKGDMETLLSTIIQAEYDWSVEQGLLGVDAFVEKYVSIYEDRV